MTRFSKSCAWLPSVGRPVRKSGTRPSDCSPHRRVCKPRKTCCGRSSTRTNSSSCPDRERDYMPRAPDDTLGRREFLRVGTLGGLSMAEFLRLQNATAGPAAPQRDVNCIFVFL